MEWFSLAERIKKDLLAQWLGSDWTLKLISSLLIILVLFVIYLIVNKVLSNQISEARVRFKWKRTIRYLGMAIGILLVGRLWIQGFQPVLTFFGLIAAALTITQKESIMNLAGWGFILWRGLYDIGDRIQIGNHKGDVLDIGMFYSTIMEIGNWIHGDQSSGRIIKIPNSQVLTNPIANYVRGFPFIFHELSLILTPNSAQDKAIDLLKEITERHTHTTRMAAEKFLKSHRDQLIAFRSLFPRVNIKLQIEKPGGIVCLVRFICDPYQRRETETAIWLDIVREFKASGEIHIAYDFVDAAKNLYYSQELLGSPAPNPEVPPAKPRLI
ncbi:MAG: mechanosensitive ion channel [SAR324 cluster bacterium]|nr:mechanosensitive ion channel [SAR324 cluster bacterium]